MIKIDANVSILKYTNKKIPDLVGLEFWKDGDWVLCRTYTYISPLGVLFMNFFYLFNDWRSSKLLKFGKIFWEDDDVPNVVTVHQIGDEGLSEVSDGILSH